MTEQVINIRDRIEKMRTQMTGPNEAVARNKIDLEKKNSIDTPDQEIETIKKQSIPIDSIENKKKDNLPYIQENLNKVDKKRRLKKFPKKFMIQKKTINPILNLINLNHHLLVKHTKITIMIIYLMTIKNQ